MVAKHKAFSVLVFFAVVLISTSVILSGCSKTKAQGESDAESKIAPQQGFLAPDFELEDLAGEKIRLSDLRGKTVVVNFWSTGCRFCLQEMPDFDEFNRSKPEDVIVLMINLDKDSSRLPAYIKNQGYSFTVLKDERADIARTYMLRGIPTTFVVDKDGMIVWRLEGPLTKNELDNLMIEASDNKPRLPS